MKLVFNKALFTYYFLDFCGLCYNTDYGRNQWSNDRKYLSTYVIKNVYTLWSNDCSYGEIVTVGFLHDNFSIVTKNIGNNIGPSI